MKRAVSFAALALFIVLQSSCTTSDPKPTMKNFKEKYSYMIGMDIGNEFKHMGAEIDYNAFLWGIKDIANSRSPLLKPETLDSVKMEFAAMMQKSPQGMAAQKQMQEMGEKNLKDGEAFLAANKTKPGIVTTASGLQYLVVKKGVGPKPKSTDKVKVHYTGTLLDGKEFDSSIKRGQPTEFPIAGIIPGWSEALQLMPVGSKYKLFIPAKLAYGERGAGGVIPPNATLVFDVELLEIVK
jgi:FKBP-type peptidyl-prolyl cis-trans isomerase FkpA